jgi:hypothetical protein
VIAETWLALSILACAQPCPRATRPDTVRTERIAGQLGRPVRAVVCYGTVPDRGVRDEAGRFLLDVATDDALLAARIAHLERHTAPPRLPDEDEAACRARLLREEAGAWAAELERRRGLGLSDPTCPLEGELGVAPPVDAVREWLRSSPNPTPAGLRASHVRRCTLRAEEPR